MAIQKPQKPKQPRKSKRLKLLLTERDKWKQILSQVDTPEAPISVIQKIELELVDGSHIDINVQELLADGYDEFELEEAINHRLDANEHIIKDASFFIDADHVANTVQPITNSILKNL
jgi:hypothetical protein